MEGIEHYVAENIFMKIVKEGAEVVAEKCYADSVASVEDKFVSDFLVQAEEWIVQEAILTAMIEPKTPLL